MERFANLLNQAKGERSINRFGKDAGVDPGYLSRLLRGLLKTAPSAAVIKKIASQANNRITVQDLLAAAGYIAYPLKQETGKPESVDKSQQMQAWEKVIEEAAQYNISPEVASELFRTLGQSLEKIKGPNSKRSK